MLPIVLAVLAAGIWGTGDFSGGKASQRASPFAVTMISQFTGLPVLVICLLVVNGGTPTIGELGRGALAGVAGFGGIVLLYTGLSRGAMAIFAPITAVTSALIPLVVGLLTEKPPGLLPLTGAFVAIVAIGLVSLTGGSRSVVTPGLIALALTSGAMFGTFFAILGKSSPDAGMWPLAGVRIGSITTCLIAVAILRPSLRLAPAPRRWSALAGPCDIGANALFLLASLHGPLTIVAPIAALYPVSTVLLALGIDRERIRPLQIAGLGLAATALVLVAS